MLPIASGVLETSIQYSIHELNGKGLCTRHPKYPTATSIKHQSVVIKNGAWVWCVRNN